MMPRFGRRVVVGAWTVAVVAGVAVATRLLPDPGVANGAVLYGTHCASCHGADLGGQPNWQEPLPSGRMPAPPHDGSGHTWHHPDEVLFRITKEGVSALVPGYESDMPAFAGVLSDAEIRAVLGYIKGTWPERARHYQETVSEAAR